MKKNLIQKNKKYNKLKISWQMRNVLNEAEKNEESMAAKSVAKLQGFKNKFIQKTLLGAKLLSAFKKNNILEKTIGKSHIG